MKVPTFLFHETRGPKLFDLAPGEAWPDGYRDTPFRGVVKVRPEQELASARATIVELEAVIERGMSENFSQAIRITELEARVAELEESLAAVAAANRPARGRPRKALEA